MRPAHLLLAASLSSLATIGPARAETTPMQRKEIIAIVRDALRTDPSILRDALAALQADEARHQDQVTRDVLTMLGPRLVDTQDPVAGNPFGDVTVVEFYDTRCPYCRRMLPVMAALLRADPKVKLVIKDLPILGPASQLESRVLLAAQRQGGYFKLQDVVMETGGTSTRDSLRAAADSVGLDGNIVLRDMDDPAIKARLQANVELARQIGIEGTPAIIIGTKMFAGATDLKDLQAAIQDARKR